MLAELSGVCGCGKEKEKLGLTATICGYRSQIGRSAYAVIAASRGKPSTHANFPQRLQAVSAALLEVGYKRLTSAAASSAS